MVPGSIPPQERGSLCPPLKSNVVAFEVMLVFTLRVLLRPVRSTKMVTRQTTAKAPTTHATIVVRLGEDVDAGEVGSTVASSSPQVHLSSYSPSTRAGMQAPGPPHHTEKLHGVAAESGVCMQTEATLHSDPVVSQRGIVWVGEDTSREVELFSRRNCR